MSELSKNELDQLFRQTAEGVEVEYRPYAWEQMKRLLRRDRRRRILWWWLLGIGLALFLTAFWLIFQPQPEPVIPASGPQAHQTPNLQEPTLPSLAPDPPIRALQHTPPLAPDPPIRALQHPPPLARELPFRAPPTQNTEPSTPNSNPPELRQMVVPAPFLPRLSLALSVWSLRTPETRALSLPPVLPEEPATRDGLYLAAEFAPELTSVGADDFTHESWKAGLRLEWRYRQKLALAAGLYYARKRYSADKGEYIPPKGFWTNQIAPVHTYGMCSLLEIPIETSYYSAPHHKGQWFGRLGISSYLMLDEWYGYSYEPPDPNLVSEWSGGAEYRHWMGILTVSAGYEYFLHPKASVQLAPYFQLPVAGVGHGNVKLYAIGLRVAINFQMLNSDSIHQ